MTGNLESIRREFAALSAALAELRAGVARHGETHLAVRGWWPVDRRRKADKLNLIETRIEGLRDVVRRIAADGAYPSKKQQEDGRKGLLDVVRASPAR